VGEKKVSEVFIHELGELRMRFLFGVTRHSAFVRISINKAITEALENLITAIDQADVSDEAKKKRNLCCGNCWVAKPRLTY
jgi:hypothetical protein